MECQNCGTRCGHEQRICPSCGRRLAYKPPPDDDKPIPYKPSLWSYMWFRGAMAGVMILLGLVFFLFWGGLSLLLLMITFAAVIFFGPGVLQRQRGGDFFN